MPCEIHERDGYVEVRVLGGTRRHEVLAAVVELGRRDPLKQMCDLWVFSKDVELCYADFGAAAEAILRMCPPGMKGNRSALVGVSPWLQAQLEFYRAEADRLPFEIRVFGDEEAAVQWLSQGRVSAS